MTGIEGIPVAPDDFRGTRAVEDRIDDGPLAPVLTGHLRRLKDWYIRDAAFHKVWWAAVVDYRERCKAAVTMVALDVIEEEAKAFVNVTEHPPIWDWISETAKDARARVREEATKSHKWAAARTEAKAKQASYQQYEDEQRARWKKERQVRDFLSTRQPGIVRGTAGYAFSGMSPREQTHVAKVVLFGVSPEGLPPIPMQFAQEMVLRKKEAA